MSKLAGVSITTLKRWDSINHLKADYRTRGNHRRYNYKRILQFLVIAKDTKTDKVAIYARVSSSRQKDDLKRQVQKLKDYTGNNNQEITNIYSDIGSGLNDNRKNVLRLISDLPTSGIKVLSVHTEILWCVLDH